MAEDEVEEAIEEEETVPEDVGDQRGFKEISQHILRIERALERRRRGLEKAESVVADQAVEIAAHQAKLVELQAVEDERRQEIQSLEAERGILSQRMAQLEAAQRGQLPADSRPQQDPVQAAQECLSRSFLGLQMFQDQPAEIQELLVQFARGVEQLQAASRPTVVLGQTTLHQAFAAQRGPAAGAAKALDADPSLEYGPHLAAALQKRQKLQASATEQPSVGSSSTQASAPPPAEQQQPAVQDRPSTQHYDISSGTATPAGAEGATEAVVLLAGGKAYGRAARKHEPSCNKCWAVCCKCNTSMDTDVPTSAPETTLAVWRPPKSRDAFLAQLKDQNLQQAERVRKRAADASSLRGSPY